MNQEQLNEAQLNNYSQFKQKPFETTLYELFNIDLSNGFNKKEAQANMRQIVRKFHPDKHEASEKEVANIITKTLTVTWRFISDPRKEICYRMFGRANSNTYTPLDWEEIDKIHPIILQEWKYIMATNPNKGNAHNKQQSNNSDANHTNNQKPKTEQPSEDNDNSNSKRKHEDSFKENPKKAKVARINKIIDHYYRHRKYYAIVEWDDAQQSRMELAETKGHGDILQAYLMNLLKTNNKRYNWLKRNQMHLFM